jgi:ferrochelatase
MSLRLPTAKLTGRILANGLAGTAGNLNAFRHGSQRAGMASVVPPVTQSSMSAKGPTAMVFMNMGGPSSTDQVGDFLSRLFVCCVPFLGSCVYADTNAGGR